MPKLSIKEYASALERTQLPPEFVTLLEYLFTEVLDGRNAWVAVTHALGRRPRDFTEYVRDAAATGVWKVGGGGRADRAAHTDAMCRFRAPPFDYGYRATPPRSRKDP